MSAPSDLAVGDWVRFVDSRTRVAFRVVAVNGETAEIERWKRADITHRRKAFGQLIDHSPYRVLWAGTFDVKDLVALHPSVSHSLAADEAAALTLPTKAQRDYARRKRRKERMTRQ